MTKPGVPHFDYPFRFLSDGHAATVEQDSDADIINCAIAVLKTPIGFRSELPDFGISDPIFTEGGPSNEDIMSALDNWEDRALYDLDTGPITVDQLVYLIRIQMDMGDEDNG